MRLGGEQVQRLDQVRVPDRRVARLGEVLGLVVGDDDLAGVPGQDVHERDAEVAARAGGREDDRPGPLAIRQRALRVGLLVDDLQRRATEVRVGLRRLGIGDVEPALVVERPVRELHRDHLAGPRVVDREALLPGARAAVGRGGDPHARRVDDVELERRRGAAAQVVAAHVARPGREDHVDAALRVDRDRRRAARVGALQVGVGGVAGQRRGHRRAEGLAAVGRLRHVHVVADLARPQVVVEQVDGRLVRRRVVGADREPLAVLVGELGRARRLGPRRAAVVAVRAREVQARLVELGGQQAARVHRHDVGVDRRLALLGIGPRALEGQTAVARAVDLRAVGTVRHDPAAVVGADRDPRLGLVARRVELYRRELQLLRAGAVVGGTIQSETTPTGGGCGGSATPTAAPLPGPGTAARAPEAHAPPCLPRRRGPARSRPGTAARSRSRPLLR